MDPHALVVDILVVLFAGLAAGVVCKRFGISVVDGYMIAGVFVGDGVLRLVSSTNHELEYVARAGALLLLFAIGIEISLSEIKRLARFFFVGGPAQMLLVAVPVTMIANYFMEIRPAIVIGAAAAFSSTILVFKALAEIGQTTTPRGRSAIGVLLFQDVALVPLILLLPLLIEPAEGAAEKSIAREALFLGAKSGLFVAGVIAAREFVRRLTVPALLALRSTELVVLFAIGLLTLSCLTAHWLGLPPALGAFAAGLILADNRLSRQVDALVLPYRETFAAVFFVTLGTLLRPEMFLENPLILTGGFLGLLLLKTIAGAAALRLVGLGWRNALATGLGLAQLGEFSFVLLLQAFNSGVISGDAYNWMLFVAIATLIMTPLLLQAGTRLSKGEISVGPIIQEGVAPDEPVRSAIVVGLGPIGRQVASQLELSGTDVRLVDLSPINLYPFEQQGFRTVAGDARSREILMNIGVNESDLLVVSVPEDPVALQIVRSVREVNRDCRVAVRCRWAMNVAKFQLAGADAVVSEEREASQAMLRLCEQLVGGQNNEEDS